MRHGSALLVAAFVAALPSLAGAQPGRGVAPGPRPSAEAPAPARPEFERPAFGGVTRILNLRRVLDLTPRQVAQLDSIERAVAAARRPALDRMRAERESMRESMRGRAAGRAFSPDSARARAERLRPQLEQFRRSDSLATVAAERLLTDAQRQQMRELRAYARGRMEGARGGRGPRANRAAPAGARGMRGPGGLRGPRGGLNGRGAWGLEGRPMRRPELEGLPLERPLAPMAPRAPRPPRPPEE